MAVESTSLATSHLPVLRQVISCDGGGVRGILTARILQGVEEVIDDSVCNYVSDFFATSTGSLIVGGLTCPQGVSAKKVVELYETHAPSIFHQTYYEEACSLDGFRTNKYSDTGLMAALDAFAGDAKFVDLKRNVNFPVIDLQTRKVLWLSRDQAREKGWKDLKVVEILRATTAAPTYFSGKVLKLEGAQLECIDGGITYNNPVRKAAISGLNNPNLIILSIGTGVVAHVVPKPIFEHGGDIEWIEPLLNTMSDVQEQTSTEEALQLLESPDQLLRIEPLLKHEILLDDASKLGELKQIAADWLQDHDDKFRIFCGKFKKIF